MPTTITDYIDQAYNNINGRLRGHDKDIRQIRNLQIPKTDSAQGRLWASCELPSGPTHAMTKERHTNALSGFSWTIPSGQRVYRRVFNANYRLALDSRYIAPRDIGTWIIAKSNDFVICQYFMPFGLATTYQMVVSSVRSTTTNWIRVYTVYNAFSCELYLREGNAVTSLPTNATLELRAGIV